MQQIARVNLELFSKYITRAICFIAKLEILLSASRVFLHTRVEIYNSPRLEIGRHNCCNFATNAFTVYVARVTKSPTGIQRGFSAVNCGDGELPRQSGKKDL